MRPPSTPGGSSRRCGAHEHEAAMSDERAYPPVSPLLVGVMCRCPRCGKGKLFDGFVVVGAALIVEALYQPPFWLHALLWLPLILITTIGPLRPMKALMIALQYHH